MKKCILLIAFAVALIAGAPKAEAQQLSLKSTYSLLSDTVVNTATAILTSQKVTKSSVSTVVQVNVTKVSGTVGGTISLMGSIDGTNFKALNTSETQTALATITATDASNVYHWRLVGNPFLYYRVSWTGTGTMNATFTASVYNQN